MIVSQMHDAIAGAGCDAHDRRRRRHGVGTIGSISLWFVVDLFIRQSQPIILQTTVKQSSKFPQLQQDEQL